MRKLTHEEVVNRQKEKLKDRGLGACGECKRITAPIRVRRPCFFSFIGTAQNNKVRTAVLKTCACADVICLARILLLGPAPHNDRAPDKGHDDDQYR